MIPRTALALAAFVVCVLGAGCDDREFFQVEIAVYGIGFGGGHLYRIDKAQISVFNFRETSEQLFKMQIDKKQSRELSKALRHIPFSQLRERYRADNIFDGAALELSVRLNRESWPSQVGMENCRIDEVEKVIEIVNEIITDSGNGFEEMSFFLSYFLEEGSLPICE